VIPFLKASKDKSQTGVMVKDRAPDKPEENQDDSRAAVKAAARALISAVHMRDEEAVADALQDAFDILDAQPHEEGPHIEPHSYDAQNAAAKRNE